MSWSTAAPARLEDERVVLYPVTEADREGLREIALDPVIWRYFVSRVDTSADFDGLFDGMLADHAQGRRAVFVVEDKLAGRLAGSTSFGNLAERDRRLEIGWSWLGVAFQGSGVNRHAKLRLLAHAFDNLGAERIEFKTDERNTRARRALLSIGAVEEGTLRSYNPMPAGPRRNAVYFSILRSEWPGVRARLTTAAATPQPTPSRAQAGSFSENSATGRRP
jgi:RimJ/RimL family protein N-acetyltransferase